MTTTSLVHLASIAVQLHGADLHPWVRENARELIVAFAMVESSGREQVKGDNGKSWGLYQFGKARWIESGGLKHEWGGADATRQTTVMLLALTRYCREADKTQRNTDYLTWCCARHNGLGVPAVRHRYYQKIVKAWPKGKNGADASKRRPRRTTQPTEGIEYHESYK